MRNFLQSLVCKHARAIAEFVDVRTLPEPQQGYCGDLP